MKVSIERERGDMYQSFRSREGSNYIVPSEWRDEIDDARYPKIQ